MAVFAHPDDETFICGGSLAKYAAEGHRIVLVCATKGEMGRRMGVPVTESRESIVAVREQELRNACNALGIADIEFLGFRDKTLEIQPFESLVERVERLMTAYQPEVIVTFHEELGGHPDHCTIGAAATKAFLRYHAVQADARLYFVAWNAMASHPEEHGLGRKNMVEVDVKAFLKEKLNAYRAHRTQSQLHGSLWKSDKQGMSNLSSTEHFVQAGGIPMRLDTLFVGNQ